MTNDEVLSINEQQKQAIEYNEGPLLIVAGAGTGKTTVITEKIKYILSHNLAKPEEILALTFTEKASREMEERIDKALPYGYFQMFISTFHAFADQILRDELINIGLNSGYKLMTSAESVIFLRRNLFLFDLKYFRPLGNPNKFIESILQHFSRLADEDITPIKYLEFAKNQEKNQDIPQEEKEKCLELANAYQLFETLKIKEGYFDFSDLLANLLKVFRKRENILKKYQEKFRYILVDEFQDTNIAQYTLIKLLCPSEKNPRLTMVGDDSQAIYKFRGASVSNILNFMRDYPQTKQITLIKNYRSNQKILDASYQLIKNNDPDTLEYQLKISKKLISVRNGLKPFPTKKQQILNFQLADKVENEADYVATEILNLSKKYKYSDFAVLVRANKHSSPFIRAFSQKGILYQFLGPGMLYKQPEIKDLIAYLKILYNLEDSPSFYRILNMDIFALDQKDIALLLLFAKKINQTLFNAIEVYLSFFDENLTKKEYEIYKKYLPLIKEETRNILIPIYKIVTVHLTKIQKSTAGQILYYFLQDTKYLNKLSAPQNEQDEKKIMNIAKFFEKLKRYELEHEDASVTSVVNYIEMCMELGESPTAEDLEIAADAVNILTIHASKGLEFPVVFLVNLTHGRFPTNEKKEIIPIPQALIKEILPEGDYHLEEERRLFYVGLTRSKDISYLTASSFYGEGKRERKISQFVIETLGQKFVEEHIKIKKYFKKQLTIFDFKEEEPKIKVTLNKILPYFSYSQIQVFETCPLLYKFQYILKIPSIPSGAASFGETIHKTLQKFYQEFKDNKTIGKERLFEIYKTSWIPLGYSSQDHQKRIMQTGEKMLTNYYQTFHHPDVQIVDLERFFKIKLSQDLFITGKIDRVDLKDKGEIEIIDYKTGKKPDEKKLKKSMQLSIYALAAIDPGLYQKDLNQVTLTFYYLEEMAKISMKKTPEEIINLKTEIEKTVMSIKQNKFIPKVGPWCSFCPYKIICEAWQ